ncbi:L,D-transpeptidase [Streptomyces sp. NBC_00080]|uniref:L,D-transpeptidase n=1 Tax=Streptomyces TaxID=1883 RepID=UPI00115319DE|nr:MULTISPECIES: L,D-transpeptidase [Streptomyces]TQJ55113.1 hypothetical protein FBY34_2907 [Streptomyces sp. SLBN-115]
MPSNSSTFVAGLTAAALATVAFLTFQASASAPADLSRPQRSGGAAKAPRDKAHPAALPADSGLGARVVYSLDDDRVWLVRSDGGVRRTFKVAPGSVDPPLGNYAVTSRAGAVTGTDGTPIEHVVRFATVNDVTIGFSAALDGSLPEPDPTVRTGGIRQTVADGDAMWDFATIGQSVVVIP